MDNIYLRCMPLPCKVHGMTVRDEEGDYNVYLNARETYEANQKTLQHELRHIRGDDFDRQAPIEDIELRF